MSEIKSYSVGVGDMFYVNHNSDNFTVIDCHIKDSNERKEDILNEIKDLHSKKGISRFISTHPDEDHIGGLIDLFNEINIINFYFVDNIIEKEDPSEDFKEYCKIRDGETDKHLFKLSKGFSNNWFNKNTDERGSSGFKILWPNLNNENFKELIEDSEGNCNNISPIFRYSLEDGVKVMWFGDIEEDFLDGVKEDIDFNEEIDVIFAPHHGRKSGKLPKDILDKLNPKLIIIGEAPSEHIHYYDSKYNTITQNSFKDVLLKCEHKETDIYVSEKYDKKFNDVTIKDNIPDYKGLKYLFTLNHK